MLATWSLANRNGMSSADEKAAMIIFLNDDRAYLYWVTHHRQGFILDGKRKPRPSHLVVHRATCPEIKSAASRHVHWTTGSKLKACGLDPTELEAWAAEETGASPERCKKCDFANQEMGRGEAQIHLSKLPSEVLEYILEAALIHFEIEHPPYHLTVADIAACFGKRPGQISPVLHRLLEAGLVTIPGHRVTAAAIPAKRVVLPTAAALRTLHAFQAESDSTLEAELAKLEGS
jgi:hypothetical protein